MPIYAYKCDSCGLAKDVLQKISDPLLTQCPACGAATFTKQLTAAGFQLKGSGWYATDFKGSPPAAGSDSTPSESKPADTASGKADSAKPDAPAASATPAAASTPAASS